MDDDRSSGRQNLLQTVGCAASIFTHSSKAIKGLGLPSQQERIVELVMQGMQDKEIAHEMGLGLPTVRSYLRQILERTKAPNRMHLALMIMNAACEHCQSGRHHHP